MNCPFCESSAIEERIIIKNDLAKAFPTNIPVVPGHVLICPVRCVGRLEDMTKNEIEATYKLLMKLKYALVKTFDAEGFNFAWNEGKTAGQNVPHAHLHMLPRKTGDTGITEYEPRRFLYRPGSRETVPENELKEITELIKKEMEKGKHFF